MTRVLPLPLPSPSEDLFFPAAFRRPPNGVAQGQGEAGAEPAWGLRGQSQCLTGVSAAIGPGGYLSPSSERISFSVCVSEGIKAVLAEGYERIPPALDTGKTFQAIMRFDTDVKLTYFRNGGILNYMIRKMASITKM